MTGRVVNRRVEPYDVYIGRPSVWGNPFVVGRDGTRSEVVEKFREWILRDEQMLDQMQEELEGKVLGCWCAPLPCHGDVILELLDGYRVTREAIAEQMKDPEFRTLIEGQVATLRGRP